MSVLVYSSIYPLPFWKCLIIPWRRNNHDSKNKNKHMEKQAKFWFFKDSMLKARSSTGGLPNQQLKQTHRKKTLL